MIWLVQLQPNRFNIILYIPSILYFKNITFTLFMLACKTCFLYTTRVISMIQIININKFVQVVPISFLIISECRAHFFVSTFPAGVVLLLSAELEISLKFSASSDPSWRFIAP